MKSYDRGDPTAMPALAPKEWLLNWLLFAASCAITVAAISFQYEANAVNREVTAAAIMGVFGLLTLRSPVSAARLLVGLYIPIWVLTERNLTGYFVTSYTGLLVAVLALVTTNRWKAHPTLAIRSLTLVALAFVIQWTRSPVLRDSFGIVCDVVSFACIFWWAAQQPPWVFPRIARGFIFGVAGAAFAVVPWSLLTNESRLGESIGMNPNVLGCAASWAIILIASGLLKGCPRWWWVCLPLCGLQLVLSESRTAFYGCAGALVILSLGRNRRWVLLGAGSLIVLLSLRVVTTSEQDRMADARVRLQLIFEESFDKTGAHRQEIWSNLLSRAGESWLLGRGLTRASEISAEAGINVQVRDATFGRVAHNLYIELLIEDGIFALLCFLYWITRVIFAASLTWQARMLLLPLMVEFFLEGFMHGLNLTFETGIIIGLAASCAAIGGRHAVAPRRLILTQPALVEQPQ